MILSDGRHVVPNKNHASATQGERFIEMHPDFRVIILANRPGFPFLG
jgi:hypothetical protein